MNSGKTGVLATICVAAALAFGLPDMPAVAAALIIDDFSTSQGPLSVSPGLGPQNSSSSASGGGLIGGARDLALSADPGTSPFASTVTVAGGVMDYSNSTGTGMRSSLLFQWDGADNDANALDTAGLGGIDLSFGGNNAFQIGLVFDDLPATLQMSVFSTNGDMSQVTFPTTGLIFTNLSIYIPFSLFVGDADLANVGAIELLITSPTNGADIAFDFIQTGIAPVPAPGAVWLLGSALLGFGLVGRRRGERAAECFSPEP